MEAEAAALADESPGVDTRLQGNVRITTIQLLARRLLVPAVKALKQIYPGLSVEIFTDPRNLSVVSDVSDKSARNAAVSDRLSLVMVGLLGQWSGRQTKP